MTLDVYAGLFEDGLDDVAEPGRPGSRCRGLAARDRADQEGHGMSRNRCVTRESGLVGQQGLEPWTDGL